MLSIAKRMKKIKTINSHTCGEPTCVIVDGGPDLGTGPLAERLERFRLQFDHIRRAITREPRGSDATVGALLCRPHDESCVAGVIFFNNVGFLGMCGHGTIGLVKTLAYLEMLSPGTHKIETPVGIVEAELHRNGEISIINVPSYLYRTGVVVELEGYGKVVGDVAWGGNWFFLVEGHSLEISEDNISALTCFAREVREALYRQGITGKGGEKIDHVELFGKPLDRNMDCRNFVLCPGDAYDRSPCGTGTSAKMASLYSKGLLDVGQTWQQESILGGVFVGKLSRINGDLYPIITANAFVTAECTCIIDPEDPYRYGIARQQVAAAGSG